MNLAEVDVAHDPERPGQADMQPRLQNRDGPPEALVDAALIGTENRRPGKPPGEKEKQEHDRKEGRAEEAQRPAPRQIDADLFLEGLAPGALRDELRRQDRRDRA